MKIIEYREKYRALLVKLWNTCGLTVAWNDPNKDIDRKLASGNGKILLAIHDGELIGTLMFGYEGHRGWLNYLAVDPKYQKSGFAKQLIVYAETELRTIGCPKVSLQIRESNSSIVEFYSHNGYTQDKVVSMGKRLIHD